MITVARPVKQTPAAGIATKRDKLRAWCDSFLLALCVVAVCALAGITFSSNSGGISVQEKRKLAEMPRLGRKTLTQFPRRFEAFTSDRMAFRNELIRLRNALKCRAFGVSGAPTVLAGKDGWYFFIGDGSVPAFRHESSYPERELQQWVDVIKKRSAACTKYGAKYIVAIAPDKPSIYPEFLPGGFRPIRQESRLDELVQAFSGEPDVSFLDLRSSLREHKNIGTLYFRTDTHWNYLGAYWGYRQIAQELKKTFPALQILQTQDIEFSPVQFVAGDCLCLMGLNGFAPEMVPALKRCGSLVLDPFASLGAWKSPEQLRGPAVTSNLRALVIHDSFGEALKPYLAQHFSAIKWVRQDDLSCDTEQIKEFRPDVVIQEIVERHAAQFVPYFLDDWRSWVIAQMRSNGVRKGDYLTIMSNTREVNANCATTTAELQKWEASPTTCREWTEQGDKVIFDEQKALYSRWYLLKTKDQGFKLLDADSEHAYNALTAFVTNSGKFVKVSDIGRSDGSVLSLYRQRE